MKKLIALVLPVGLATLLLIPDAALSRVSGAFGYSPADNIYLGVSRDFHSRGMEFWGGLDAFSLTHIFMPFVVDSPFGHRSPAQRHYSQPVYSYPPEVPPGLCRWERTVLGVSGRPLLDARGMPVKEYTIGSCTFPPN